jgi:purine-cytosine permease-like protein
MSFLPGSIVVGVAVFFILLSAFKINVTNAYAGSLAWSNFFSRVLHRHPGRIVWVFFNVAIATVLMQIDVFSFLNTVLGFYSNVAIAWIGAVVADLVIIKPLKLSPSYIEFKRAHLFPINPVGFGALLIASTVSIVAYFGAFGETLDAYSPFLALVVAMVAAPLIAVATKGRYYIARESAIPWGEPGETPVALKCTVCEQDYEAPDMAQCPFHSGPICSLCCTLEKTCDDMCKAKAEGPAQKILAG